MAQDKWGVITAGYEAWFRSTIDQPFIIKEGEPVRIISEFESDEGFGPMYSIKTADGSAGVALPVRFVELF